MKTILVTGGAGYIGSHTCVELLNAGYGVVVVDNLSNGCEEALERVQKLAFKDLLFVEADVRDQAAMTRVFDDFPIDAVIHFAGLKSVAESVRDPELYFDVNLNGTVVLCDVMDNHGVKDIVYSSTASVYGFPSNEPIAEFADTAPAQPYGESKLAAEDYLRERHERDSSWNVLNLRYFNPVGAHPSGEIGEDPKGTPDNLTPYITQVAIGKRDILQIFGDDWDTVDGTGVRDYIHVVDLARGHVKALEKLADKPGQMVLNLGTGRPYSVLEVRAAFERISRQAIPYEIKGRRAGDIAIYFADPSRAEMELGWHSHYDIDDMARDAWNWQKKNPHGYS
ncbi:MAG: UDP-glucose 4-epimerase GalE [Halieaceae bacterium]